MFKLSVITDEVSQDFAVALDFAQKHKLSGVEIRSVYEKGPFELEREDVKKLKEMIKPTGLQVCCISSPFYKCELDSPEEISRNLEGLKRCTEIATELDTKLIRGFTFWARGDFYSRLDDIAECFMKPIDILKDAGLILVLEFDPTVYATNAAKLKQVIQKINSPYVKALWDPGNDIYDPDKEQPYPTGYELIKDEIRHIHLKDAHLVNGVAEGTPMCKGEVDYRGQFLRLIEDGYDGFLSLETHYRPTKPLSEELLQMPKGSVFSYMGLEASTESILNMNELFSQIMMESC